MNYFKQIKAFYDLQLTNRLSSGQTALWYALMYLNNSCAWKEKFTATNQMLESLTGLSRQGISKARNVLRQKGYVSFIARERQATIYTLKDLSALDSLPDSLPDEVLSLPDGCPDGCPDGLPDSLPDSLPDGCTLNNKDNTKTRLDKKEIHKEKFQKPTLNEVEDYCADRKNGISASAFIDHYESNGWKVGRSPMKDWRAAVRQWERRREEWGKPMTHEEDGFYENLPGIERY